MHTQHIEGMVERLKPQLKDPNKARLIIQKYWNDRMAIVWTLEQIHCAANEQNLVLTNLEARQLLHKLHEDYDSRLGLHWFDVMTAIEENGLGRKIKRRELYSFLNKNKLAVSKAR